MVHIRAKEITLTDALKAHINGAIESFSKYHLNIISYNVNITKKKNVVSVEFDIKIAQASEVVVNQSDEDIDVAIDLAIERANKALRRLHDRLTEHKGDSLKDLEVE